jgi:aminocarboxymuconate-semialdehyde decarboxylase
MRNRREFFGTLAGATAGMLITTPGLSRAGAFQQAAAPGTRRQVSIAGRRVKVIDVHAHCEIAEVAEVVKGTPFAEDGEAGGNAILGPKRIALMDSQGVDYQALSINGYWWWNVPDRDLAGRIVKAQNEGLAKWVAAHPDRFVAFASIALQFPDLAAQQLEDGVKRLGMRGATVGGHMNNEDLSHEKFDPFWAKAAELNVPVFMHPGGAGNILKDNALDGRGNLGNIIGNPLETTYFLSRLIYDGTFDKFPTLKVVGAHGGGYLPSYFGRTEAACVVRANANCANKKKPSEYLKQNILADTMVFSDEGLRHLVAEMGVSQVVYGTDVPFNWPVTVDLVLNASHLTNADKEAILSGNLMKLLRISA